MDRRTFLKASAACTACSMALPRWAEAVRIHGGDLKSCLQILNLFGEKPKEVVELYSAIYNALATDPRATFKTVSEDEKVRALVEGQRIVHLGGPMLGEITESSAKIWVRTVKPASVEVKAGEKTFGPVKSSFETDLTAIVPVTGLKPGTETSYKVLVDGKEITNAGTMVITTPPQGDSGKVRIAFGTCQHRWGLGNEKQADAILSRKPHALLAYGDVAVQDRKSNFGMCRADYALRDFHPAWQKIVATTPVYASWDDHDYYANDAWGIPRNGSDQDRRDVRAVFKSSWNNPYYGLGDEGGGIFQHTRVGPCDIIMTDNRYFREKEGKHCFLGKEQMAWLKRTLKACRGPFIIMSCGTMWSDYVSNGKDSWGKYDQEGREEIFSLIEEEKIGGVLLISGDRHGARAFTIPRPSGFKFYEFEPASLGGRGGPAATSENWKTQLYGTSSKYAFGEFSIDASLDDPEVTFRLIHQDAEILYEITLKRSQLTPA